MRRTRTSRQETVNRCQHCASRQRRSTPVGAKKNSLNVQGAGFSASPCVRRPMVHRAVLVWVLCCAMGPFSGSAPIRQHVAAAFLPPSTSQNTRASLYMATSSKELKVERHERRRKRMIGSLVQADDVKDVDATSGMNSTLGESNTANSPDGADGDVDNVGKTSTNHKTLRPSEERNDKSDSTQSNHDILNQSGLVRLQRAARAELKRREEKALKASVDASQESRNVNAARTGARGEGPRNNMGNSKGKKDGENSMDKSSTEEEQKRRAITRTWIQKAAKGQEDETSQIISLDELNKNIDKRLNKDNLFDSRAQLPRVEGTVQPPVRDSMASLLSYNHLRGDWRGHQSSTTYNVALVFGKPLVRDQITVEYSSRIRTLARLFKDNPLFRPSLIYFTGGVSEGNHVSDADAGYIFFRHMCEAQGIDLEGVDVLIDSDSSDEAGAIYRMTEILKNQYVPRWLKKAPAVSKGEDKTIAIHFSLVSTEYHLCNLNDVHHRSPRQSLLKPIEAMTDDGSGGRNSALSEQTQYGFGGYNAGRSARQNEDVFYDDWGGFDNRQSPFPKGRIQDGQIESSWSFQYATYPFLYAQDEAVVYLGKCFLLAEELMPLLVNMKGVVEEEEFFQRDNYLMLASIRRSLVSKVERLHKSPGMKRALKRYQGVTEDRSLLDREASGTRNKDIIAILEGALLSLGRCVDLVRPAGLLVSVVSAENWRKALRALQKSLGEIRSACDPDRPLRPEEWGKLVDEEDAMLDIGFQRMQHFVLWKDKQQRQTLAKGNEDQESDDFNVDDDGDIFDDYMFSSLLDD